ncbi:MAG: hypothetical protein SO132_00295 [Candidatus Enteromonas sp.]|nr:hypothetical protein [Candidatus Enteromonas sp.]
MKKTNYLLLSLLTLLSLSCAQGENSSSSPSKTEDDTLISTKTSENSTTESTTSTTSKEEKATCKIQASSSIDLEQKDPGAKLYKFSKTLDLEENEEFSIILSINEVEETYGFDALADINNISGKDYANPFFISGENGKIKASLKGSYTIYVIVENDKTVSINIDVNSFVEPIVPAREAYFVGEGSFNTGDIWTIESGIKGEEMHDNPNAKEKFTFNVNLDKNDKFMFTLKDTAIWHGFSSFKGVTNKVQGSDLSKPSDFFTKNDSDNIITKYKGNYTFYLSIWENDSADIWVDVETFEIPVVENSRIVTTEGLASDISFDEVAFDSQWEKFKFEKYSTFSKDDEFKIKITSGENVTYVGFSNIEGHGGDVSPLPDDFLVEGKDNSLHLNYSAGITFIVTGKIDGSIAIWYNVYSIQTPSAPELEPGCYVKGLWDQSITKPATDDAPNASENILHKYEAYGFFYHDDILTIKIADSNKIYEFGFDDIKAQNKGSETLKDGNFLRGTDDNKIQVISDCDFTLYLTVYTDNSLAIWATVWNYY